MELKPPALAIPGQWKLRPHYLSNFTVMAILHAQIVALLPFLK